MFIASRLCLALSVTAILVACGGGGDEETIGGAPVDGPVAAQPPSSELITYTPEPGHWTEGAVQQMNEWRTQCGFTALTASQNLALAGAFHTNVAGHEMLYVTRTGAPSVMEAASSAITTGVTPRDRATYQRYPAGPVDEALISYVVGDGSVPPSMDNRYGRAIIRSMAQNPSQLATLFRPAQHVGIASGKVFENSTERIIDVYAVDLGSTSTIVDVPAGQVQSFPCEGTNDVIPDTLINATAQGVAMTAGTGAPLYLRARTGSRLSVTSASITSEAGQIDLVPAQGAQLATNEAVLVPPSALMPLTTYTVTASMTVDGARVSKVFSFTTGKLFGQQMAENLFAQRRPVGQL